MDKDWIGNTEGVFKNIGANNHAEREREKHDYYATEPKATELLLELETFSTNIWECACGEGHISKVLEKAGYKVTSTDLVSRGYGKGEVNFLECAANNLEVDIITNPPYKYAKEFVEKALEVVADGQKVAMFLKLTFLETQGRKALFKRYPPKYVYVSVKRITCARNGDFTKRESSAVCYAWFIWVKGFTGEPTIRWFN